MGSMQWRIGSIPNTAVSALCYSYASSWKMIFWQTVILLLFPLDFEFAIFCHSYCKEPWSKCVLKISGRLYFISLFFVGTCLSWTFVSASLSSEDPYLPFQVIDTLFLSCCTLRSPWPTLQHIHNHISTSMCQIPYHRFLSEIKTP